MRAMLVPADVSRPVTFVDVDVHWQPMTEAIGADYIEFVRTPLEGVAMLVDEEGLYRHGVNPRVSGLLYPGAIHGDVLVCGEVDTPSGKDVSSIAGTALSRLALLGIQASPLICHATLNPVRRHAAV